MNKEELYNAVSHIDEDLLDLSGNKSCDSVIGKDEERKMSNINIKKILVPIAACIAVAFIATGYAVMNTDNNIGTSEAVISKEQPDIAEHSGDGDTSAVDDTSVKKADELTVSSDLSGAVLCAYDIDYSDPYAEENNTPEKREQRVSSLAELMNIIGASPVEPEYGVDGVFPYVDTGEEVITAFSSYLGVDTACISGIAYDSPDSDVVRQLTGNGCISALIKYIGLDKDNLYVYRESLLMYGDNEENTEPVSRITTFKLTNCSEKPQQLAFNLSTNFLMFKIIDHFTDNTTVLSSVYGYFVPKSSVREMTDYLSYSEALKSVSEEDASFSADASTCTVIYKPDITNGTLMPYYEFHWKNEKKERSFCVPLEKRP